MGSSYIFFTTTFCLSCLILLPHMNPLQLIHKYYSSQPELETLLIRHSRQVAGRALTIACQHPEWGLDLQFVYEAAMLHDIGILKTDADGIFCHGTEKYICHGRLGAEILREEGLERHARVAERHTGTGLTARQIEERSLPLPVQDFVPESLEEKLICYADKFYSKSHPEVEKTFEQALQSLKKFGEEGVAIFTGWHDLFEAV